MFKDRIYRNLSDEFEKYGISEEDVNFIAELIHYEKTTVDTKYKNKAFLFQVCDLLYYKKTCVTIIIT